MASPCVWQPRRSVLAHVAVAVVGAARTDLLGCQTHGEAIRCLSSVRHHQLITYP